MVEESRQRVRDSQTVFKMKTRKQGKKATLNWHHWKVMPTIIYSWGRCYALSCCLFIKIYVVCMAVGRQWNAKKINRDESGKVAVQDVCSEKRIVYCLLNKYTVVITKTYLFVCVCVCLISFSPRVFRRYWTHIASVHFAFKSSLNILQ